MEETKKWGGKREGSGRPKKDIARYVSFGANSEVVEILDKLDCPKAEFLNAAVLHYAKHLGMI